ncbi:MAG: nitroreductase family protein [Acidobacteria bacterium]|nr:nitroreductase family protein [Acidobacteriota bacterium]
MICLDVCPNDVFILTSHSVQQNIVQVQHPQQCFACGHCIALCPGDALTHEDLPRPAFEKLLPIDISPETMQNLIVARRAIRSYTPEMIPEDIVNQLLEAAIHGGTAYNGQSEGIIVIRDKRTLRELEAVAFDVHWKALRKFSDENLLAKLATLLLRFKYGQEMINIFTRMSLKMRNRIEKGGIEGMVFRNAPLLIVMHSLRANYSGNINCAIALRNIELLALTRGLGTCWTGYLTSAADKSRKVQKFLSIPRDRQIHGAVLIGYPKYAYRLKIPRKRREIRVI